MQHPRDEYADDFGALAQLAEAFLQLVEALHDAGPGSMTAQQIVELASRCMPRGRVAAIAVQDGDRLDTIAATSDAAAAIDRIRVETGQGPALDAVAENDVVISGQLADDPRWPDFGRRVTDETDITAVATYRLYLGPRFRGALTFYSEWPYAFDDIAITTGAIFAAYTSLALHHQFVLQGDLPYARARSVHTEIGVAVGILLANGASDVETAYRRLQVASRALQTDLPSAARTVIEGDRPATTTA